MFRKSGVVFALACAPIVAALLMFSGCGEEENSRQGADNPNARNELNKDSMDYMRNQYDSKKQTKKK